MAQEALDQYIASTRAQGFSDTQIKQVLLEQGYKKEIVLAALQEKAQTYTENKSTKSDTATQNIARENTIKHRNPILVLLFSTITFGIYFTYWLYSTAKEMNTATQKEKINLKLLLSILFFPLAMIINTIIAATMSAMLAAILSIVIMFVSIIITTIMMIMFYVKHAKAIHELTDFQTPLLVVLWILASPAAIVISQIQLNKVASK